VLPQIVIFTQQKFDTYRVSPPLSPSLSPHLLCALNALTPPTPDPTIAGIFCVDDEPPLAVPSYCRRVGIELFVTLLVTVPATFVAKGGLLGTLVVVVVVEV
jgi:hypothetical protein